jgi:SAM-dependent methyltransferase
MRSTGRGGVRGPRAAAFLALVTAARVSESAARLFTHAAAGLLRLAELRASIAEEWRVSGAAESDRYVLSGLMEWERAFYFRFLEPADRILLVGCGTGRDLIGLLERGYRVEGLDLVPECIGTARRLLEQRRLSAPLYSGGIETIALQSHYDAVIFSWFCYGLVPHGDARVVTLRRVAGALAPGGRILVSYIPAAPASRTAFVLARLVARLAGSDWQPEDDDVIRLSGRRRTIARYAHSFPPAQLAAEAQAAGLRVLFHDASEHGLAVLAV